MRTRASLVSTAASGLWRTGVHSLRYVRGLLEGNAVTGDVSWVANDKPPVLLVHGFLGTRGTMEPLARRLRADGRVVFNFTNGLFALGDLRRNARDLAAEAHRLHRELGVERFDVIGFSMGGLVALEALLHQGMAPRVRRIVTLGAPIDGTLSAAIGVATVGLISRSVYQSLPGSGFLHRLRTTPLPEGVQMRQIHAGQDVFCALPAPLPGVDTARDYVVLPGGHSSLVVTQQFYARVREFLDSTRVVTNPAATQRSTAE